MKKLTAWDVCYSANITITCALSYAFITAILRPLGREDDTMKGGMWAVVSAVFVFQDTRGKALTAGVNRLIATRISVSLCLAYLLTFPFTGLGMAVVIGLETLVLIALGRKEDIVTAGITTTVVMVVAGMNPDDAWRQPVLRFFDSVVGIATGVAGKSWIVTPSSRCSIATTPASLLPSRGALSFEGLRPTPVSAVADGSSIASEEPGRSSFLPAAPLATNLNPAAVSF